MAREIRSAFGRHGVVAVGALVFACGCSAILGISDLKPEELSKDGGTGGATGTGGSTGDTGGQGGSGGTTASTSGSGGTGGGTAGSTGNPTGGTSGGGNGGTNSDKDGGTGATDGGGGTTETPVSGKLIDYFGRPLPGVPMTVGGTYVATDSAGKFSVPNVTGTYDISLTITYSEGYTVHTGWFYEGLTRRDPVLQVYTGLTARSATVDITVQNVDFTLDSQTVGFSFAGVDGEFDDNSTDADYNPFSVNDEWYGGPTTSGTMHALFWKYAGDQDLPSSYVGYDSHPVALNVSVDGAVTFNLKKPTPAIPTGSITGTVTGEDADGRQNDVYVRYTDGAVIHVAQDDAAAGAYSYVVPTISGAAITVAASDGDYYFEPYAVAYKDDLVAGQTASLVVPTPPSLTSPVGGATGITPNTVFHWTTSAPVSLVSMNDYNLSTTYIHVVTAKKQTTIPSFPESGLAFSNTMLVDWLVETHGSPATVDAATGSAGMLDEFASGYPRGAKHGSGSYTESTSNQFTTSATFAP